MTDFPVIIKQNKLAKRLKLKADYTKGEIVLVMPTRCSKKYAEAFIKQNQEWINEKSASFLQKKVFRKNDTVEILGKSRKIVLFESLRRHNEIDDNEIIIYGRDEKIHDEIIKIAKEMLLKYAYEKASEFSAILKVNFKDITIKNLKSRFGSCSSYKNINLSLKLAFFPLFVTDMVIAHEIAHLKEMNHSKRFKDILESIYPMANKADEWLKTNAKNYNLINLD